MSAPRVVIVGGGMGGIQTAKTLTKAPVPPADLDRAGARPHGKSAVLIAEELRE